MANKTILNNLFSIIRIIEKYDEPRIKVLSNILISYFNCSTIFEVNNEISKIEILSRKDSNTIQCILQKIRTEENLDKINLYNNICLFFEKLINKKDIGAYYTKSIVANYLIENSLNYYFCSKVFDNGQIKNSKKTIINEFSKKGKEIQISILRNLKIIDISCGSGSLIFSCYEYLLPFYQETKLSKLESLKSCFENNLYGIDIDHEAIEIIRLRLNLINLIHFKENEFVIPLNFQICDSLKKNHGEIQKIIDNGGFDVTLGNPPYIEYGKIKESEGLELFKSFKCKNIYAYFLEKNYSILKENGISGMIIPISYVSTKRMKPIRELISNNSRFQKISSFADRPSCLFSGVHQKINIVISQKSTGFTGEILTTKYNHWNSSEEIELFKQLSYQKNNYINNSFIPKLGNSTDARILSKIYNGNISLIDLTDKSGSFSCYVNMRIGFWVKTFNNKQKSNEYKQFTFGTEKDMIIFNSILNSNLFFFYWETISDCWHLTLDNLKYFKISYDKVTDTKINNLRKYLKKLEIDLEKNKKGIYSKQTDFEYQHKKSKIIIDNIDDELSGIMELKANDINYLKDYQAKYRLNNYFEEYLKQRKNNVFN